MAGFHTTAASSRFGVSWPPPHTPVSPSHPFYQLNTPRCCPTPLPACLQAFVVVGDFNGHVGLGVKCAKEVATAIRGGCPALAQRVI